jgi:DeoR/GlpR family transcriptional regulator of sugar metabolism
MKQVVAISNVERQAQIHSYVEQMQRVRVDDICVTFSVSMATARRDLDVLAKNGKIQRVHGGAIATRSAPPEPPIMLRSSEQADEKRRIGRAGAALINDGDTIFLGSGTTVLEVAHHLHDHRNITVITNSLLVVNTLAAVPNIQLVCLGGLLRQSEMSFIGHLTEQALGELRADKVFIGIRAIDTKIGLTNDYLPETQTDRAILNIGRQVIVVADCSKCAAVATTFVAPISAIHTLITDTGAAPEFVVEMMELGVNIITV